MQEELGGLDRRQLNQYTAGLRRVAIALLGPSGDQSDADDLVQDTIMLAMRRGTKPKGSLWGYLSATLRNRHADRERAKRVRENGWMPIVTDQTDVGPAELIQSAEDAALLGAVVNGLPEPEKGAILRHFYFEIPVAKIAEDDGVAPQTVRYRIQKGLRTIKARLAEQHPDRTWHGIAIGVCGGAEGVRQMVAIPTALLAKKIGFAAAAVSAIVATTVIAWPEPEPAQPPEPVRVIAAQPDVRPPAPPPSVDRPAPLPEPPVAKAETATQPKASPPTAPTPPTLAPITGRVVDANKLPISGLVVAATDGQNTKWARTNLAGEFSVVPPVESSTVFLHYARQPSLHAYAPGIKLPRAEKVKPGAVLDLTVNATHRVPMRVVDDVGHPVTARMLILFDKYSFIHGTEVKDGNVIILARSPGPFRVHLKPINRTGYLPTEQLTTKPGTVTEFVLRRGAVVKGAIRFPEGVDPVRAVAHVIDPETGERIAADYWTKGSDGMPPRYRFNAVEPGRCRVRLIVRGFPEHRSPVIDAIVGKPATHDFELKRGGVVKLTISGADPESKDRPVVTMTDVRTEEVFSRFDGDDGAMSIKWGESEGTCRLRIGAGEYRLCVEQAGRRASTLVSIEDEAETACLLALPSR